MSALPGGPHPGTSSRELGTKHPSCWQGRTALKQESGRSDPQQGLSWDILCALLQGPTMG